MKNTIFILLLFIASACGPTLSLTCPSPTTGVTITQHAQHRTLSADSTNFCKFYLLDRRIYPAAPGVIQGFAGTTAPLGTLLCDGTAVSRTTYAALFATIGTAYGVGDGSTTFNVPDFRQRYILGKAAAGTGSTLGGTGGTIDYAHLHTVDPPATASGGPSANVAATILAGSAASPAHTHMTDISSFNSGTTSAYNPAFGTANYIIVY